jgi:ABC-type glycerol-3-phosphate transport system substrate-binding protein
VRRTVIGSTIALGLLLAAIPAATGLAQDKPKVLVWTDAVRLPGFEAYRDSVADTVDVTVELVAQADILPKIQLAKQAGSGAPDVVFAQPNEIALYQSPQLDYALEWTPELAGAGFLEGFGKANHWCEIDGKTWCVKNDLAQTVLWYDSETFKELGLTIPTTMDEFATTALKLHDAGYSSGAIGEAIFYAAYLWPSGCPVADVVSSTELHINSQDPKCTRVAELVQPLVDAGALDRRSPFDAGFIKDIAGGKVAMTLGPSWYGDFVIRDPKTWAHPAGRISTAPMPKWAGDDVAYSGEWGGGIFVANKGSQDPQAAIDTLKWMVSDPEHVKTGPTFPAYGPANEIWTARVATDDYYVGDVGDAMTVQSQLIRPSVGPVRYPLDAEIGATLAQSIRDGQPIQAAIDALAQQSANLAQTAGYSVTQ